MTLPHPPIMPEESSLPTVATLPANTSLRKACSSGDGEAVLSATLAAPPDSLVSTWREPHDPGAVASANHNRNPAVVAQPDDLIGLPWEVLNALVNGVSAIDLHSLPLRNETEIERFIAAYGYDCTSPADRDELEALYTEAVQFIENRLLAPGEEAALKDMVLSVPPLFRDTPSVRRLLRIASSLEPTDIPLGRQWACAILKVMHGLIHITHAPHLHHAPLAQKAILQQFRQVLSHHSSTGQVVLGHPSQPSRQLPLYGVELKQMKSRESLLIKMLSKKANMVDEIDDIVGIRIITETVPDVLLALDILRQNKLIVFSNINPNRSRNSLLEMNQVRELLQQLQQTSPCHSWAQLRQVLNASDSIDHPEHTFQQHNPVSSGQYRSLHLTCRHVLRLPTSGGWAAVGSATMRRVFFPYEIQLIDRENYRNSQQGECSHAAYKQRQLARARVRVLGGLLPRHALRKTADRLAKPLPASVEFLGGAEG